MVSDLRARLVEEAMRMLVEDPAALTLRAVARAAGVSAMAPYRHFPDKAALLDAVKSEGFQRLRAALLQADQAADDSEALIGQGLAYLRFAADHPAMFRLMFAGSMANPPVLKGEGDTAYGVMARRIASLAPRETEVATTAAWAIVHGLAVLQLDGRLPPGEAHARAVMALFVQGLSSPVSAI